MEKKSYGIYLLIFVFIVQNLVGNFINIAFAKEDVVQLLEEEIDSIPLEDEEQSKGKDDIGNQSNEDDKTSNHGQSEEDLNEDDNYKKDTEEEVTDETDASYKEKKEIDNSSVDEGIERQKSKDRLYKIKFVNNGVLVLDKEKEAKLKGLERELAVGEDLVPLYKEANEILEGNYIWITSDKDGSEPYNHMPEKNITLKPIPIIENDLFHLKVNLNVPENFKENVVVVHINRKSNNKLDEEFEESISLEKQNGWKAILKNLEKKDKLGNYYTYFIEEISETNWILLSQGEVAVDESTDRSMELDLKIINRPVYPPTGGSGSLPFMIVGSIIFLMGFSLKRYKYMEKIQ